MTAVGSNSDARKRRFSGPPHSEDVEVPPTTPRVARSIDDLRVGMWVTYRLTNGGWQDPYEYQGSIAQKFFDERMVVILEDPPAPPAADWLVPADTMLRLADLFYHYDNAGENGIAFDNKRIVAAARAVLDAATEVERP